MHFRVRAAVAVAALAILTLTACTAQTPTAGDDHTSGLSTHVHAIITDPTTGTTILGTHDGLLPVESDGTVGDPIGGHEFDAMGLAVTGDAFVASGHPGANTPAEWGSPHLGIIRSDDAGQTWSPIAYTSEKDFHALTAGPDGTLYGISTDEPAVLTSTDGGSTWTAAGANISAYALTVDDTGTVYATTPGGFCSAWTAQPPSRRSRMPRRCISCRHRPTTRGWSESTSRARSGSARTPPCRGPKPAVRTVRRRRSLSPHRERSPWPTTAASGSSAATSDPEPAYREAHVSEQDTKISLVGSVALATGVMIGAGIFALVEHVAGLAGDWFPVAFIAGRRRRGRQLVRLRAVLERGPVGRWHRDAAVRRLRAGRGRRVVLAVHVRVNGGRREPPRPHLRHLPAATLRIQDSVVLAPLLGIVAIAAAAVVNLVGNQLVERSALVTAVLKIVGIAVLTAAGLIGAAATGAGFFSHSSDSGAGDLLHRGERAPWVECDGVLRKLARTEHLNRRRNLVCGEVLEVLSHDRAGSCNDGRGDHLLVVLIGKTERALQRFPPFDLRIGELAPHRCNEGRCAACSLRYGDSPFHELGFLVILELFQDRRAPGRSIRALDREGKEEVTLQARPQHAGVEGRREHDPHPVRLRS